MNPASLSVVLPLVVLLGALCSSPAANAATAPLSRAIPESEGVSSRALLEFVEAAEPLHALHSVMVVRHGRVVAEGWWGPYEAAAPHELYSLSKSFTSTAVGLAISEGRFSLDDEVLKFFPEDAPSDPSPNLRGMRVRDLLTMSAGHQEELPDWIHNASPGKFLAHAVPHKPGTHFKYNSPGTFMLSAIVQRQTGQPIVDYLQPRLFDPLGIPHPTWETNSQGVCLGGTGLRLTTESIARFGQLYLRKGTWGGRPVVPAVWVDQATSRQVSTGSSPASDWDQGYGFQFWRSRHGGYRGDGAYGQYCLVLPELDAVVAITSGARDMQQVLNLVWEKLLPAFHPRTLPSDRAAAGRLRQRLAGLVLPVPAGSPLNPAGPGRMGVRFAFAENKERIESVMLQPGTAEAPIQLLWKANGREESLRPGVGAWTKGRGSAARYQEEPMASSAAWTAPDTLVLRRCFYQTPFTITTTFRFSGDRVELKQESELGLVSSQEPPILGRRE